MALPTLLRHPLASKRCLMVFNENGEETPEMFELLSRYEGVGPINCGAYGYVCSARDNELVEKLMASPPDDYKDPSLTKEERQEVYDGYTLVAIKKLRRIFESNQPRMWLCATREIKLMMSLRHDNVMSAVDFFIPLGGVERLTYESMSMLKTSFDSVYIVMKKMDYTLREVLDASFVYPSDVPHASKERESNAEDATGVENSCDDGTNSPTAHEEQHEAEAQAETAATKGADEEGEEIPEAPLRCSITQITLHPLTRDYRKFILYQILQGVGYMHMCQFIHRDLKPENIMLDRSYQTCVTDFGQGRDVGIGDGDIVKTILDNCTQWYAAPETLSIAMEVSTGFIDHESFHSADVWSIGCVAAEMLIGRPLFYTSTMGGLGQLRGITELIGVPSETEMKSIGEYRDEGTKPLYFLVMERLLTKYANQSSRLREILKSPYGDDDEDEVELIRRCLAWDPRDRITIRSALESPFFTKDGYDPVIDTGDIAERGPALRAEDISEAVSGRALLWGMFLERHPEVRELWNTLACKHEADEQRKSGGAGENATEAAPVASV